MSESRSGRPSPPTEVLGRLQGRRGRGKLKSRCEDAVSVLKSGSTHIFVTITSAIVARSSARHKIVSEHSANQGCKAVVALDR